jgi:hypothetical protein
MLMTMTMKIDVEALKILSPLSYVVVMMEIFAVVAMESVSSSLAPHAQGELPMAPWSFPMT